MLFSNIFGLVSLVILQFHGALASSDNCYRVSDSSSQYKGKYVLAKYYSGKADPNRKGTYCHKSKDKCQTFKSRSECVKKYKALFKKLSNNKEIFTKRCRSSDQKKGWCKAVQKGTKGGSSSGSSGSSGGSKKKAPTCGDFFATIKKSSTSYCNHWGYMKKGKSSDKCGKKGASAKSCKPIDCCNVDTYWQDCGDLFRDMGKDWCTKNGYKHRRSHDTLCNNFNPPRGC
eukprot:Awhi_evm1s14982